MFNTKVIVKTKSVLNNQAISVTLKLVGFVIMATAIPAVLHVQWVTGPLVNAVLFLSVIYCGLSGALIVGMVPSTIALSAGLLPVAIAPAIPFIILGNAVMVSIFSLLKKKSFWTGVVGGSVLKAAFLFLTVPIIAGLVAKPVIVQKIVLMFSWPQLVTALAGGVIAVVVVKIVQRLTV